MQTSQRVSQWVGAAAAVLLLAACAGDGHRAPVTTSAGLDGPATLALSIPSPSAALGGVLLELSGPGIGNVTAADTAAERAFVGAPSANGGAMRVAVVGRSLTGALLRIQVAHASEVASISARVLQASGTSNELLPTGSLQPRLAVVGNAGAAQ